MTARNKEVASLPPGQKYLPKKSSFSFVMNVERIQDFPEFELIDGCILRPASQQEIAEIKHSLTALLGDLPHKLVQRYWEYSLPGADGRALLLPPSQWRYFVIAFNDTSKYGELQQVFDLSAIELEVGFTIFCDSSGSALNWEQNRLQYLRGGLDDKRRFFAIGWTEADGIARMHAQLQNHDHKLLDLRTATAQLAQLKSLPTSSPLLLLGYFALLESMLTHVPNPTDTIDSITRQIKKKLSLINNRWPREVDYAHSVPRRSIKFGQRCMPVEAQ